MDPATAKKFWPIYDDYQSASRPINDQMLATINNFMSQWDGLSDSEANQILDSYFDLQIKKLTLKQKYVKKFRRSLPPAIVARFFQIDNKLDISAAYNMANKVPLIQQ